MDKWSEDPKLLKIADNLKGKTIQKAKIVEDNSSFCILELYFDGKIVEVGVCGNVYDEAYFFLEEINE